MEFQIHKRVNLINLEKSAKEACSCKHRGRYLNINVDDINGCARERVRRDRQTRVRAERLEEAEHHDEGENGH